MKTKKRLVNYLAIAFLATTSLTACSSGSSGSSGSTSTQPPITDPIPSEGDGLSFDPMDAAKELAGEIGPYVLNYITKGKFETDDEIWKAQLKKTLKDIQSQVNSVINLENKNLQLLQDLISMISQATVTSGTLELQTNLNSFQTANEHVAQWVSTSVYSYYINQGEKQQKARAYAQEAEGAYAGESNVQMSATNLEILVGQAPALATQLGTASDLDTTEANISCDMNVYGPNGVVSKRPDLDSNACYVSALLGAMNTQLIGAILPVQNSLPTVDGTNNGQVYGVQGANSLITLQQYYNTLDLLYADIYAYYNNLYLVDQMRTYIYIKNGGKNISAPSFITPSALTSYTVAEKALKTAFNAKMSSIQTMIEQAKLQAYNATLGPILSSSLSANCSNLSLASLESVPIESNFMKTTVQASMESGAPYWDTVNLVATCSNPGKGVNATLTTNNNIGTACILSGQDVGGLNGSYNITVNNGYIKCGGIGTSPSYTSNYVENSIPDSNKYGYYGWYWNYTTQKIAYSGNSDVLIGSGDLVNSSGFFQYLDNTGPYSLAYPELGGAYEYDSDGNIDFNFFKEGTIVYPNAILYSTSYATPTFTNGWYINIDMSGSEANSSDRYDNKHWSFIDDGTHAYLIQGVYWAQQGGGPLMVCLPNDLNCVQGYANGGAFLAFTNGDVVTMNQIGTHGDYNVVAYYSGDQSPINISAVTFPSH